MEIGGLWARQEVVFCCCGDCLAAVVHVQLAIDVLEVGFDGVDRDAQGLGDFLVGLALGEEVQDVEFAIAEGFYEGFRLHSFRSPAWQGRET